MNGELSFTEQERAQWKNSSSDKLPDSTYTMSLNNASMRLVGKEGDLYKSLILDWEVVSPQAQSGRKYTQWMSLKTESNCFYTRGDLELLGVDTDCDLEMLDSRVREKLGTKAVINLITNGKYQNAKLERVVEGVGPALATAQGDDIPF